MSSLESSVPGVPQAFEWRVRVPSTFEGGGYIRGGYRTFAVMGRKPSTQNVIFSLDFGLLIKNAIKNIFGTLRNS